DLTRVYVPTVGDEAIRDLTRAREDTLCDLKSASSASKPSCFDRISVTWAGPIGTRPTCGGSLKSSARHRRSKSSFKNTSERLTHTPNGSNVWSKHCKSRSNRGACSRWSTPFRLCAGCNLLQP